MSDPKEQQLGPDEPDGLDLDAETVQDLEPTEEDAHQIQGGYTGACGTAACPR